jgi:transposase-like protein
MISAARRRREGGRDGGQRPLCDLCASRSTVREYCVARRLSPHWACPTMKMGRLCSDCADSIKAEILAKLRQRRSGWP